MSTPISSPQTRRRYLAEPSEPPIGSPGSPKPGIRLVPYSPPRFGDRATSRQSHQSSDSTESLGSADGTTPRQAVSASQSPCPSPLGPPAVIVAASRSPSPRPLLDQTSPDRGPASDAADGRHILVLTTTSTPASHSDTASSVPHRASSTTLSTLSPLSLSDAHTGVSTTPYSSHSLDVTGLRSRSSLSPLGEIDEADEIEYADGGSPVAELPRLPHSLPRRRKLVAVRSDKTFSLVPLSRGSSSSSRSHQPPYPHTRAQPLAYRAPTSFSVASTAASSTQGRQSDLFFDDRPSSPATTIPEADTSPCGSVASEANWVTISPVHSPVHSPDTSPALPSHPVFGGLRKVPRTPDSKHPRLDWPAASSVFGLSPPEPLVARAAVPVAVLDPYGSPKTARNQRLQLVTKPSLQSIQSYNSEADTPNYRTYGSVSPESPSTLSLAASYAEQSHQSKAASSPLHHHRSSIDEIGKNENYIVYGSRSPSSSSLATVRSPPRLRPQFSQESLAVAPLKPGRRTSIERLYSGKSRSRESLRRTPSLASISSYFTHEALHAFLTTPFPVHIHRSVSSGTSLGQVARRLDNLPPTSAASFQLLAQSPSAGASSSQDTPSSMDGQLHPWSSQLSTVASESEGGSGLGSRPGSFLSKLAPSSARHSSSDYPGNQGHYCHSISSPTHSWSLSDQLEAGFSSYIQYGHRNERYMPPSINYQDEDGDGLADLHQLHHRPSRPQLSSFFSNSSLDRSFQSSVRSRANSFSSTSLPAWARLYYGGGERKLLMPSSESLYSAFIRDRDPQHPTLTLRSDLEPFQPNLRTQRHPVAQAIPDIPRPASIAALVGMTMVQPPPLTHAPPPAAGLRAAIRKKTSSIWSPHLAHDRRTNRYSIWVPPQTHWTSESARLGRRDMQRLCFIAGFVFPFAWMIASLLPLPPSPNIEGNEAEAANPDFRRDLERNKTQTLQEIKYRRARWWRHVNRCMSVVGLLVIAAIIALSVVGVRERWGSSN